MSRNTVILLVVLAFAVGVGVGMGGLLFATGNLAPSSDTSEVVATLDINAEPTANPAALSTENANLRATIDAMAAAAESAADAADAETAAATPEPTEEAADPTTDSASGLPERALFRITEDGSEARFLIPETLGGNDITVVGTTNRVAGDVIVNFNNPSASTLGEIAVNARTLRTDQDMRNQAIRGLILKTGQYEFITFKPTAFEALTNEPVNVGDTVEFQVTGDLTIVGVTKSITFDTTVTVVSENRIEGLGRTEFPYRDFNISINAPPTVRNIGDIVTLELEFVANLVEE